MQFDSIQVFAGDSDLNRVGLQINDYNSSILLAVQAKAEADAKRQAEEQRRKSEADARAKAEADAREKREAEEKARTEAKVQFRVQNPNQVASVVCALSW